MNEIYYHALTTPELLQAVDRTDPQVKELAHRLEYLWDRLMDMDENHGDA